MIYHNINTNNDRLSLQNDSRLLLPNNELWMIFTPFILYLCSLLS